MGRKNRDLSYLKPFCFYCDKAFKNEVYLHQHQKAKHFTCQRCQKKFSSCDSLKNHAESAHHENLSKQLSICMEIQLIEYQIHQLIDVTQKIKYLECKEYRESKQKKEYEREVRKNIIYNYKAEEYWFRILSVQYNQRRKEKKERQRQNKELALAKQEKKQDNFENPMNDPNNVYEYDGDKAQPISFKINTQQPRLQLQLAKKEEKAVFQ